MVSFAKKINITPAPTLIFSCGMKNYSGQKEFIEDVVIF